MAYKIKHLSDTECRIEYAKNPGTRRKKRVNLTLVVFAIIALMMGVDFGFVLLGFFAFIIIFRSGRSLPPNFEIELNRSNNRLIVKNCAPRSPKMKTYPLDRFRGFGFHETPSRSKRNAGAKLFLKLGPSEALSELVPIRKPNLRIPIDNAQEIITKIDKWLGLPVEAHVIEYDPQMTDPAPEPEPKILRDFRDME